jgi:hypothetical protein
MLPRKYALILCKFRCNKLDYLQNVEDGIILLETYVFVVYVIRIMLGMNTITFFNVHTMI